MSVSEGGEDPSRLRNKSFAAAWKATEIYTDQPGCLLADRYGSLTNDLVLSGRPRALDAYADDHLINESYSGHLDRDTLGQ